MSKVAKVKDGLDGEEEEKDGKSAWEMEDSNNLSIEYGWKGRR
jgi:hypothetical protein